MNNKGDGTVLLPDGELKNEELSLRFFQTAEADGTPGSVPRHYFRIFLADGTCCGMIDLRAGHTERTWYGGNIGYHILEEYRGHHYAEKACRLLFPLAAKLKMEYLIITCNPDNAASRRTCERLGAGLLAIETLPPESEWRLRGDTEKCIFRVCLPEKSRKGSGKTDFGIQTGRDAD